MPVFRTKREAFEWLHSGKKKIDVRKGNPLNGEVAVYLSGRKVLRLKISKTETGLVREVIRLDNFRLVIPSAVTLDEAVSYLIELYNGYDGVFTAYHIVPIEG